MKGSGLQESWEAGWIIYREVRALPGNEKMEVTATEQAAWEICSLKAKKEMWFSS